VLRSVSSAHHALVDRLQRNVAASPDVLSLAGGLPAASLFPRRVIAAACLAALGRTDRAALQYGWPEGSPELREWIAARLRRRGAGIDADDVIITSGAQQAIALAIAARCSEGDTVAVDPESYPAALDLFRARGLEPTTSLAASIAYVMPGVGNPRSTGLDDAAMRALVDSGIPIIADEAYTDLRFDGRDARLLLGEAPDRTFHVGTFSKTLCPGFRIGWLVPPREYRDEILTLKSAADLQANSLGQAILTEMIKTWDYDAHLTRARRLYGRRAAALCGAVRHFLPAFRTSEPEGGFSIFVETDRDGDDASFLEVAIAHGVAFDPGRSFRVAPGGAAISLRLCHSNLRISAIEEAVRRLAAAWKAYLRKAA
jgi:2-aminoadipate transaminase